MIHTANFSPKLLTSEVEDTYSHRLICVNFMKKGKVSNESIAPFVTGFLSSSLWMYYGMLLSNRTLVSVNAFGSLLFATYTWMYYKYTTKKKRVVHCVISVVAFIFWIVYITDTTVHQTKLTLSAPAEFHQQKTVETAAVGPLDPKQPNLSTTITTAIDRVGFICCVTTMLFFAAPLSNLIHVMKTKNTESLPMPMIAMTFLVSAQWLVYGKILRDKFIMYPNAVGCILSAIQLSLFIVYSKRSSILSTTDHHNYHHPYPYNKLVDA
ncbi:Hypothetical protein CINCED_3A003608 [Cinara cedri]|uniref:Sugar transporter SWEET n=1 Tax=Cinara cedri TaxID=506608 RepID=A0A5E4N3U0_9HEMI|nr:Hypothetical protein CINCED_3A003608 [Cinara cedri]